MAMKFETHSGEPPKRHEYFHVNPRDIVCDGARGRRFPPTPEKVRELAKSLVDHGQQQPIVCRKGADGQLHAVSGFTRIEAAKLIREELLPQFTIKVTVANVNEREAAIRNVVENDHRNPTSPIDDAHNQRDLSEKHGLTPDEIAALYNCDTRKLSRLARLLELPDDAQLLVHTGQLPIAAALNILDLKSEDSRKAALAHVAEKAAAGEKVNTTDARKIVRDEASKSDKAKKVARNLKELGEWMDTHGPESASPEWFKGLVGALRLYLKGERGDTWLDRQVYKLFKDAQEEEGDA